MKYLAVILTILASVFFARTQFARNNPSLENTDIQLHIGGSAPGWVFLRGIYKNVKSKIDSTWLDADGNARFKYPFSLDPGYYTIELSEDRSIPLLLDRDQAFSLNTEADRMIEQMQVTGSQENSLLYDNLQFDLDLQERFANEVQLIQNQGNQELDETQIGQLRQQYFTEKENYLKKVFKRFPDFLFTKYESARQQPQSMEAIVTDPSLDPAIRQQKVLISFWETVDFSDPRLIHTPVIFDKLWQYLNQYVPDYTDVKIQAVNLLMERVEAYPEYYEFFARYITDDYQPPYNGNMDPDALYVHMVDRYLTKERAVWADSTQIFAWQLRAADQRVSLTGMKAGNIEAKDPNGRIRALFDISSPYIALFFYHYDCDHCIETTPKLVEQYKALKEQGLQVYAVAMDTPEEEWRAFIERNGMDWINVTDEAQNNIYKHYFVRATPEIILLNPERIIIGKHLAAEDLSLIMQMDRLGAFRDGAAVSDSK